MTSMVRRLHTLEDHSYTVHSLAWSSDGLLISAAGEGELGVWSSDISRIKLSRNGGVAIVAARSLDDLRIAAGFQNGNIRLYARESDECTKLLADGAIPHPEGLRSLAVLDKQRLISIGRQSIIIWDTANGDMIHRILSTDAHGDHVVNCVAVLGGTVAVTGARGGQLIVWNVADRDRPPSIIRKIDAHKSDVNCLAVLSPDRIVSSSDDRLLRIWDPIAGVQHGEMRGHDNFVAAVTASFDGRWIASKSTDGTLRLWDAATCSLLATIDETLPQGVFPVGLAFHPSRHVLASLDETHTGIRIWDVTGQGNTTDIRCPNCSLEITSLVAQLQGHLETNYIFCPICKRRVFDESSSGGTNGDATPTTKPPRGPRVGIICLAFIASPSDCDKERKIIVDEIHSWNNLYAHSLGCCVLPMSSENVSPDGRRSPQTNINEYAVELSDFAIAVFRNRFGTPTGCESSGTVEEIERFLASNRPAITYFFRGNRSATTSSDVEQLVKQFIPLDKWRKENFSSHHYSTYGSLGAFRKEVRQAIKQTVERLLEDWSSHRELLERRRQMYV